MSRSNASRSIWRFLPSPVLFLGLLFSAPANAGPISVIEELLVPGGPSGSDTMGWVAGSSRLSSQSHRFAHGSDRASGPPIRNVVPLEGLGLPEGFGLVVDQSSSVPAYQGLTYQMSETVRIDATWDFGPRPNSVEGYLDLHLGF